MKELAELNGLKISHVHNFTVSQQVKTSQVNCILYIKSCINCM